MGNACTIKPISGSRSQVTLSFQPPNFPLTPGFLKNSSYQLKNGDSTSFILQDAARGVQVSEAQIDKGIAVSSASSMKTLELGSEDPNNVIMERVDLFSLDMRESEWGCKDETGDRAIQPKIAQETQRNYTWALSVKDANKNENEFMKGQDNLSSVQYDTAPKAETLETHEKREGKFGINRKVEHKNKERTEQLKEQEEREIKIAKGLSKIFGEKFSPIKKSCHSSRSKENSILEEYSNSLSNGERSLKGDILTIFASNSMKLDDLKAVVDSKENHMKKCQGDSSNKARLEDVMQDNFVQNTLKKTLIESIRTNRNHIYNNGNILKGTGHQNAAPVKCYSDKALDPKMSTRLNKDVESFLPPVPVRINKDETSKGQSGTQIIQTERKYQPYINDLKSISNGGKSENNQCFMSPAKKLDNRSFSTPSLESSETSIANKDQRWDSLKRRNSIVERLMESMLEEKTDAQKEPRDRSVILSARKGQTERQIKEQDTPLVESNKKNSQNCEGKDFQTPNKLEIKKMEVLTSPLVNTGATEFVSVTELLGEGNATEKEENKLVKQRQDILEKVGMGKDSIASKSQALTAQEVEILQKEIFERMSLITASLKGPVLSPSRIQELKEIQNKLQILAHLGSKKVEPTPSNSINLIPAPSSSHQPETFRGEIGQKYNAKHIPPANSKGTSDRSFSPVPTDPSFIIKPYDVKSTPKVFDVDLSVLMNQKNNDRCPSRQFTDTDSSILRPTQNPVESRSTLEYLEAELECLQNPRISRVHTEGSYSHQNSARKMSKQKYPEGSQRSVANHRTKFEDSSKKSEPAGVRKRDPEPSSFGLQQMIKKLPNPKNLSTYMEPNVNQKEGPICRRVSLNNYVRERPKGPTISRSVSPEENPNFRKQDILQRRQSAETARKTAEKSSNTTQKGGYPYNRKSSAERIKTLAGEVDDYPRSGNYAQEDFKARQAKARLSVGSETFRGYLRDPAEKSTNGKIQSERYNDNVRGKHDAYNILYARNSVGMMENNIIKTEADANISEYDTNQAKVLCEEITRLDKKLAIAKTHIRTLVGPGSQETYSHRVKICKAAVDFGRKEVTYAIQAKRKAEILASTQTARGPRRASENSIVTERRPTTPNLDTQPDTQSSRLYMATEPSQSETKKGKHDYSQSIKLRMKYFEEISKKQSNEKNLDWMMMTNMRASFDGSKSQSRIGFKSLL